MREEPGVVGWVGFGIRKSDPFARNPIPLKRGRAKATCFLTLFHTVGLDEDGYLYATHTSYAIRTEPDPSSPALLRYEYDRDPNHSYPNPHFHVPGSSDALAVLNSRTGQSKKLEDLHFPLGGRRFRPTLEDLIEFLVEEGFVKAARDWRDELEAHRDLWLRRQLQAAVRRDPDAAQQALDKLRERES